MVSLALADSAPSQPTLALTFQDQMLTAQIVATPLKQVMGELSKLTGAQVRWLFSESTALVSVSFRPLPLDEALDRLLDQQNFLLFYTNAGQQLTQVWISSPNPEAKSSIPLPQFSSEMKGEETLGEAKATEANDLLDDIQRAALKTIFNEEERTVSIEEDGYDSTSHRDH